MKQLLNNRFFWVLIGALILFLVAVSIGWATQPTPYKIICHHNPSQNVTLSFQNEQSYSGHLGTPHSAEVYDTDGACVEPSITPSVTPSVTPSEEPECDEDCAEPSVTPIPCIETEDGSEFTVKDDEVVPCDTPTPTPTPTNTPHQDVSDGRSSCPDCTKTPPSSVISLAPCTATTCGWK